MPDAWRERGGEADVDSPERNARLLGYLGLVPFLLLSVWLYTIAPDHPWRDGTIMLLKAYGAIVLSFLGGMRWGLALAGRHRAAWRELAIGVLPPLFAWIALAVPVPFAFGLLAVAFAAQGAWDSSSAHGGRMPAWLGALRIQLTVVVVATLVLGLAATV